MPDNHKWQESRTEDLQERYVSAAERMRDIADRIERGEFSTVGAIMVGVNGKVEVGSFGKDAFRFAAGADRIISMMVGEL